MAQGLADLVHRLVTDGGFRDAVAGSITRTASEYGVILGEGERAVIAEQLGQLMAPPRAVGGEEPTPWPGGPSFTGAALDH